MGGEKDAKGDGKTKHKTTKLKKLSDHESAGAGGDALKNRWVVCTCVCLYDTWGRKKKKKMDTKMIWRQA